MDEMDRDVQAIWRFTQFLARSGHLVWDHGTAAEVIGAYVRDPLVQREIARWRYAEIDGLGQAADKTP